jgi:hypothetical protein
LSTDVATYFTVDLSLSAFSAKKEKKYSRSVKIKQAPLLLMQLILKIAIALLYHLDGTVIYA